MGPEEAAYCVKEFLPTPKRIIPMHFGSFPVLTGTAEDFQKHCEEMGVEGKTIIHPKEFLGGAPIVGEDKSAQNQAAQEEEKKEE